MKRLAVILVTCFSLFLCGERYLFVNSSGVKGDTTISSQDKLTGGTNKILGDELCFISIGGNVSSGNTTSYSASARLSQTGRRVSNSTKTSFQLVKGGKLKDGRGSFLGISLFQPLTSTLTFNRHLYFIRVLRL